MNVFQPNPMNVVRNYSLNLVRECKSETSAHGRWRATNGSIPGLPISIMTLTIHNMCRLAVATRWLSLTPLVDLNRSQVYEYTRICGSFVALGFAPPLIIQEPPLFSFPKGVKPSWCWDLNIQPFIGSRMSTCDASGTQIHVRRWRQRRRMGVWAIHIISNNGTWEFIRGMLTQLMSSTCARLKFYPTQDCTLGGGNTLQHLEIGNRFFSIIVIIIAFYMICTTDLTHQHCWRSR